MRGEIQTDTEDILTKLEQTATRKMFSSHFFSFFQIFISLKTFDYNFKIVFVLL